MTQKSFKFLRVIMAVLLSAIMAEAVISSNYILAIIIVVGAVLIVSIARKKVEGVLVDERTVSLGGKSARMALTIFSIAGAALSFVLLISRNAGLAYEIAGSVLAYSVCVLLILYSLLFKYYEKQN